MIRNSSKTLTWLIKLAFFSLLPASIKTVYRVQNCRRLSIDLFEKIILKTLLLSISNIQEDFVTLLQAMCTQLVLRENILSF